MNLQVEGFYESFSKKHLTKALNLKVIENGDEIFGRVSIKNNYSWRLSVTIYYAIVGLMK